LLAYKIKTARKLGLIYCDSAASIGKMKNTLRVLPMQQN